MRFDWKKTLGVLAPTIATALGGPLAGAAVHTLGGFFGLGSEASEVQIAEALHSASPEKLAELKKLEQAFVLRMKELDIDVFELEIQDRDSARKREMALGRDRGEQTLAFLIVIGFMLYAGGLTVAICAGWLNDIEAGLVAVLGAILGYMSAKAELIVSYFWGSSKSSKEKTQALMDQIERGAK